MLRFFDPAKDTYYDALNKKRQCIRKLIDKSMSAEKRLFLHWNNETKHYYYIMACKNVIFGIKNI